METKISPVFHGLLLGASCATLFAGFALPARADGGLGGTGFGWYLTSGGSGFTGMAGNNGLGFAGAGGGGAGGGAGGHASGSVLGGVGGTALTPDGQNGQDGVLDAGAGGGGGYNGNGTGATTLSNAGTSRGGNGGDGGNADPTAAGGGGGGGAGGYGAVVLGSGASSNTGVIAGGHGGDGGMSGLFLGPPYPDSGGFGGDGGRGVQFTAPGATFTNSGAVVGGNGGAGGLPAVAGATPGGPGFGGIAVAGSDLTIINSGSIAGGFDGGHVGDEAYRVNAILFTGGTNRLELWAGSTINGNVVASGSSVFALGGTTNSAFNVGQIGATAQYQGFNALEKTGTGTWTLTGTSTTSAPWTVNGGTLLVNGSIASSSDLTVNAGGTIGGSGTLPTTTVNGGILSPGNSIGTITIAGNLALTAASTYLVEVSPTDADRTNVSGTATLGGATVSALYGPGSYVTRQYTILNAAGGVTGTFSGLVNTDLPSGFRASLSYDANNAYLDLTMTVSNFGAGLTINQTNVATALVNSFNTAGGIPLVYGTLTPYGLSQASGEIGTQASTAAFQQNDYFLNLMLDPFVTSRDGTIGPDGAPLVNQYASNRTDAATRRRSRSEQDAYTAMARKAPLRGGGFDPRWSVWGAAYGGEMKTGGDAAVNGSHHATARAYGFAVGADYRLSPDTLFGFAVSGGESRFSLSDNLGSGRADVFQAGAFARHNIGSGYLKGALAYGWHDVDTDRLVTAAGIDKLTANYDAHSVAGRIEGGYRFVTPWMGVTPYAAGQAAIFLLPGYSEQVAVGASNFALNYASKDISTSRTELGVRADKQVALGDALLTLRGRAAWAHYYEIDRALFASFQALPASGFTVFGAEQARNVALVSAAAETKWRNGFSIAGVFEGEFSDRTTGYAGKGVLRYQW